MTTSGTWNISITGQDGTNYFRVLVRERAPSDREIVETTDDQGKAVKIELTDIHFEPPKSADGARGIGIWEVKAKEI